LRFHGRSSIVLIRHDGIFRFVHSIGVKHLPYHSDAPLRPRTAGRTTAQTRCPDRGTCRVSRC
jgi:hypothetical protein